MSEPSYEKVSRQADGSSPRSTGGAPRGGPASWSLTVTAASGWSHEVGAVPDQVLQLADRRRRDLARGVEQPQLGPDRARSGDQPGDVGPRVPALGVGR